MSARQVLARYGPVAALVEIVRLVAAELAPATPLPAAALPEPSDPWLWTSVTTVLPVILCR